MNEDCEMGWVLARMTAIVIIHTTCTGEKCFGSGTLKIEAA